MRVITGSAKGRRLKLPPPSKVRPASDKVKGAIFNILGSMEELNILDLFAGSGSVGIEALSRGAASAVFVESDREVLNYLKENLSLTGFLTRSEILSTLVQKAILFLDRHKKQFDLVFVDPPYDRHLVQPTLQQLADSSLLHSETILVVEHSPREKVEAHQRLAIIDQRQYGQTHISFLRKHLP